MNLLPLVAQLNAMTRERMQHLKPEYLAEEAKRLKDYQDQEDTRRQLARYGVKV